MSESERLVGGPWLAEDIQGRGVIDNAQSTITIEAGGAVSGSGGCNRIRGSVTIDGARLAFSPLATTRMMCAPALMDQEQKFLRVLEATRSFRFEGTQLKFLDAAGAELIRFTLLR